VYAANHFRRRELMLGSARTLVGRSFIVIGDL
jgi:hypothetical protein